MNKDEVLIVERDGNMVSMTMNRPPANAVNFELIAALLQAINALSAEESSPGIVLTGSGDRFFSAGGDIKEVVGIEIAAPRIKVFHALLCAMESYPAPIVCARRGYAAGGALEFLLVVANPESKIGFPEINHGLLPATKGMRQAVRKLGIREARGLLFWGDLVDARKATDIGAIDEIVPTADVMGRAVEVCRFLCGKDRKLFAAIKRSLNLTGQMNDASLEAMTVQDLSSYLTESSSANARARFLSKGEK